MYICTSTCMYTQARYSTYVHIHHRSQTDPCQARGVPIVKNGADKKEKANGSGNKLIRFGWAWSCLEPFFLGGCRGAHARANGHPSTSLFFWHMNKTSWYIYFFPWYV